MSQFDYTKKLDAESRICYDSARNDSVFFGKAKAAGLRLHEERSRAPGNRTPLVKVVEVKLLVTYLIFHLSVTHIGRTEERK